MNERIRELATQAGYKDFDYAIIAHKFAELLIKNCAGIAEVSMPINSQPDERLFVKNSVLKHFGVE